MRTEGNPNSSQRQMRIVGQIEISIITSLQKSNSRFWHSAVILSNTIVMTHGLKLAIKVMK